MTSIIAIHAPGVTVPQGENPGGRFPGLKTRGYKHVAPKGAGYTDVPRVFNRHKHVAPGGTGYNAVQRV